MTLAMSGTGSVKPWLISLSVAVEIPSCDALVTVGAVKVTVTVQDAFTARELWHVVENEKLFALAPVPAIREMLSETVILPWLLMVITREAACAESTSPKLTLLGETTNGNTVKLAVAVLPGPPLLDVTLPVVLVKLPNWVGVTVTLKVQLPLAFMVAPESEMVFPPLVVRVPPQTVLLPF